MNLAALWKLPALFVCINNQYGMGTRVDHSSSTKSFPTRAEAFGLNADYADGVDAVEVYEKASALLSKARKGEPGFLEVSCYRFYGHARKDKSPYRSAEEEAEGRKRDPVHFMATRLEKQGVLTEADLQALNTAADTEMDAAQAYAEAAPVPEPSTMFEDVYSPTDPKPVSNEERLAL
jgi:pyruvate dehydrogenase E1 component alpha subunit